MIKARPFLLTIASVLASALARAGLGQIVPDISLAIPPSRWLGHCC
jgi:hypothetical protein